MQEKYAFKGQLLNGVQSLSFSPSGKFLAALASDNDNTVAVFNLETGIFLKKSKGDVNKIFDICMRDDSVFATSGPNHFKEWTLIDN
jgi:WD40 repeat protein